jgi:hypothetical protein
MRCHQACPSCHTSNYLSKASWSHEPTTNITHLPPQQESGSTKSPPPITRKKKLDYHDSTMRFRKTQVYLRTTQHQPTTKTTTIHQNTRFVAMSSSTPHHHTSLRWENQHTFRHLVPHSEQEQARRQGREVPFLESKLEMLNRHLLDTNHRLRVKLDEVRGLERRVEELQRRNGELVQRERRLGRRNGELVQENELLRALSRGGRR